MRTGEIVRWRRRQLGMTQPELAAKIRLRRRKTTAYYICRLERGKIDPPLSFVRSLARALGIRPWLLVMEPGNDSTAFWESYLALAPTQKRAVQHYIKALSERSRW